MSIFAPKESNGGPRLKFAEMEIVVEGPRTAKNGVEFYLLKFQFIPFFNPDNVPTDPKALEPKTWKTTTGNWSREYVEVTWPSMQAMQTAGLVKDADELFTAPNETSKSFFVSYKTPLFLIPARDDDIKYAKDNDRFNMLQEHPKTGQIMKKTYPVELVNIYPRLEEWEADARKEAVAQPPSQAQTTQPIQDNIECAVILDSIQKNFLNQWLVLNEAGELIGLNVDKALLSVEPFLTYLPEIKRMVAKAIVAEVGSNENKIKGILIDGFLDFHGPEITNILGTEEFPF